MITIIIYIKGFENTFEKYKLMSGWVQLDEYLLYIWPNLENEFNTPLLFMISAEAYSDKLCITCTSVL